MSKLNIDQQTIKELFSNKRSDFLIPDYQRPYAWEETECQTLWDDIFAFAFPENDYSLFKSDEDEYFLGPIVTFKNTDGSFAFVITNNAEKEKSITIQSKKKAISYTLPPKSIVSFLWDE